MVLLKWVYFVFDKENDKVQIEKLYVYSMVSKSVETH